MRAGFPSPRGYHEPPIGPVIILRVTFSWAKTPNGMVKKKMIPKPIDPISVSPHVSLKSIALLLIDLKTPIFS
jgi:hypothetical protein